MNDLRGAHRLGDGDPATLQRPVQRHLRDVLAVPGAAALEDLILEQAGATLLPLGRSPLPRGAQATRGIPLDS